MDYGHLGILHNDLLPFRILCILLDINHLRIRHKYHFHNRLKRIFHIYNNGSLFTGIASGCVYFLNKILYILIQCPFALVVIKPSV